MARLVLTWLRTRRHFLLGTALGLLFGMSIAGAIVAATEAKPGSKSMLVLPVSND